eukprot:16428675-Heterocapsa_arctica.AAC.1
MDSRSGDCSSSSTSQVRQRGMRRCSKASSRLRGLRRPTSKSTSGRGNLLALRRYEEAASVMVPDQIKCAIVAQHVPKAIKRFLKMIPSDVIYNYNVLKTASSATSSICWKACRCATTTRCWWTRSRVRTPSTPSGRARTWARVTRAKARISAREEVYI